MITRQGCAYPVHSLVISKVIGDGEINFFQNLILAVAKKQKSFSTGIKGAACPAGEKLLPYYLKPSETFSVNLCDLRALCDSVINTTTTEKRRTHRNTEKLCSLCISVYSVTPW